MRITNIRNEYEYIRYSCRPLNGSTLELRKQLLLCLGAGAGISDSDLGWLQAFQVKSYNGLVITQLASERTPITTLTIIEYRLKTFEAHQWEK